MFKKISAAAAIMGSTAVAMAQTAPTTVAELAGSVDLSEVKTALLAVAGVVILMIVGRNAIGAVVSFVRGKAK